MKTAELLIHPEDIESVAAVLLIIGGFRLKRVEEYRSVEQGVIRDWSTVSNRLTELADRFQRLLDACSLKAEEQENRSDELQPLGDMKAYENLLERTESRLHAWQQESSGFLAERRQLKCIQEEMDWLSANSIPWEEVLQLELLHPELGWIPAGQVGKMHILYQHTPLLILFFPGNAGRSFVLAAGIHSSGFILSNTLATLYFQPLELTKPEVLQNVKQSGAQRAAAYFRGKLKDVERKQQLIENQRRQFIDIWRVPLVAAWRQICNDLQVVRLIEQYALPADGYYYLSGSLAEKKTEQFMLHLKKAVKKSYALLVTEATGKRGENR